MTTENKEEAVYRCPKFDNSPHDEDGNFEINATRAIKATVDGTGYMSYDEGGDTEWDGKSSMMCTDCNHIGPVSEFEIAEIDQHRLNQRLEGMTDNCLFCDSTNISYGRLQVDGTTVYQKADCGDCGKTWDDAYELNRVVYDSDSHYHTTEQKLDRLKEAAREMIGLLDKGTQSNNAEFLSAIIKIRESL